MKHKTGPEEENSTQKTVDGPGSQLRKARERKGLDQAKVAAQLHLSQALIQALEWDDYDKLPAAVFVQGYLKNYARMLGVDEMAVIQAYQALQPDASQEPLTRNQPDQVAKDLHKEHRLGYYLSLGVVLALGILLFFWWQGRMDTGEAPAVSDTGADTIEPVFAPEPVETLSPPQEPAPLPAISSPVDESAFAEAPDSPTTGVTAPDEPQTDPMTEETAFEMAQPQPAPEAMAEMSAEPELSGLSSPTDVAPSGESGTQQAAAEPGLVVFAFSGPCWVEVRDVNGRARIIGVMQDGMSRRLDARLGPFRVVIGDIHAASLTVNGEAYDLGRHTRGKVARFTLDPSRL